MYAVVVRTQRQRRLAHDDHVSRIRMSFSDPVELGPQSNPVCTPLLQPLDWTHDLTYWCVAVVSFVPWIPPPVSCVFGRSAISWGLLPAPYSESGGTTLQWTCLVNLRMLVRSSLELSLCRAHNTLWWIILPIQTVCSGINSCVRCPTNHPSCVAVILVVLPISGECGIEQILRGSSISVFGFAGHHDTVDMPRGPELRVGVPTK